MKKHRISSGAIIVQDDKFLLVRHQLKDKYDFWVAPGGGILDEEDILSAAVREAKEETGFTVEPIKPIYIEQFHQPTTHHMKTWVLCALVGGDLSVDAPEAAREHIVEAKFFSHSEVKSEKRRIFPELISNEFWKDLSLGFPEFKYLGFRKMEFY